MQNRETTPNHNPEQHQPELVSQFRLAHQDAVENAHLQQDLNRMWKDHHLTKNDRIGITTCKPNPKAGLACGTHEGSEPQMGFGMMRNGEDYTPNENLVNAFQQIAYLYDFDRLEAWPCLCFGQCGNILFARFQNGVLIDLIAHEDGCIARISTTGEKLGDGEDDYDDDDDASGFSTPPQNNLIN